MINSNFNNMRIIKIYDDSYNTLSLLRVIYEYYRLYIKNFSEMISLHGPINTIYLWCIENFSEIHIITEDLSDFNNAIDRYWEINGSSSFDLVEMVID